MDFKIKKCPFHDKPTAGLAARSYSECTESTCRFHGPHGNRCAILENHETLTRIEQMLEKIMHQVGAR